MKTTGVSSIGVSQALRYALMRSQSDLSKAQKEMATLKHADAGLTLGTRTAQVVNFQRDLDRLNGIVDSNAVTLARLASTQTALSGISDAATDFLNTLTASISGDTPGTVVQGAAQAMLSTLASMLNRNVNGENLFSGTNTDVRPLADFSDASSPARTAFDAAFQAHFGFAKTAPAAAAITAAGMDAFLTAAVEPQFLGAGWQANWSSATDQGIVSRISLGQTSTTSVSANAAGLRQIAMAAATIGDLMASNLGAEAKLEMIKRAAGTMTDAIADVAELQSQTGVLQKRVADASDRIRLQTNLFEKHLVGLEGVDPTETATRVSDLVSHIDTSLALTARIQQLSLLRYLS